MEIYRQFLYRVPKLSSALPLLETIDDALQTHGVKYGKLLFHLRESPYAKISACDRVVKKLPTLHSCLINYADSSKDQIRALTNFGPDWKFGHSTSPVIDNSLTILKEVAAGIPRPFPFHHAAFIFDNVQWWQGSQPTTQAKTYAKRESPLASYLHPFPTIVAQSCWWTSGRDYFLSAVVVSPPGADDAVELPPLPPSTQNVLSSIGRLKQERWEVKFDSKEKAAFGNAFSQVSGLERQSDEGLAALAQTLPFLYPLPARSEVQPADLSDSGPGPLKATLVAAYKPLGYRYDSRDSGHGTYELKKTTKRNNQLTVYFDVGPMSQQACCLLLVEGLGWKTRARVPLSPHSRDPENCFVTDQDTWKKIVANSILAIEHFERSFVPQVELLFPPTPKWYRYGL